MSRPPLSLGRVGHRFAAFALLLAAPAFAVAVPLTLAGCEDAAVSEHGPGPLEPEVDEEE